MILILHSTVNFSDMIKSIAYFPDYVLCVLIAFIANISIIKNSFFIHCSNRDVLGISAVVYRLFPKPVNLPQKTVGYRLTLIQLSNLYFSLVRVILLELNHCCA